MPSASPQSLPNEPFVTENYVKGAYKDLFIKLTKLQLQINKLIIPEKGDNGELGEKGLKGEKGEKGDNGIKGYIGQMGQKGSKGEKGIAGEKGEKGEMGDKGIMGMMGLKGIQGSKGEDGISEIIHKFDLTQIKDVKADLNKISSQIDAIQMKLNKKSRWKFWS